MFGLSCEDEVMAYDMYTKGNLERRYLPMRECRKYVKAEHQDLKQFQDNCKKWKVVDKNKMVDIYEYSATYCLVDCDVLCQAFAAFDKLMHEVCVHDGGSLRLNKYDTLQSMVDEFLHAARQGLIHRRGAAVGRDAGLCARELRRRARDDGEQRDAARHR
jgi:hypothetical protein